MNAVKGETRLKLEDGREYVLVLDHEGLVQAEAGYGKPIDQLLADAVAGFAGAARALLFGALQARHAGATLSAASEMLFADRESVMDALTSAAEAAFPSAKVAEPGASTVGNGRGGTSSGGSGAKRGSSRKGSGGKPRARSS